MKAIGGSPSPPPQNLILNLNGVGCHESHRRVRQDLSWQSGKKQGPETPVTTLATGDSGNKGYLMLKLLKIRIPLSWGTK